MNTKVVYVYRKQRMPSKKGCPKSKTRNSQGRCVVRHSKTLSKKRRACPPGTRKGSKNGKKACVTVKRSRTSSKKAYVRPSSPFRMSAARRDLESLDRPMSPARMSAARVAVEGPVAAEIPVQPERVEQRRDYMDQLRLVEAQTMARNAERRQEARNKQALSQLRELEAQTMARNAERRAERRALGFVTPASPAQSFVSARSATPVDLTFATEVLQNAVVEEIPEMVPATIIPIRVSPETVEAEVAFAREMQQEAEAAAAYDQELADQGRPRRSNRVRRAPQRLRFGG